MITSTKRLLIYKSMLTIMESLPERSLCLNGIWEVEWSNSVAFCRILFLVDPYSLLEWYPEIMAYRPTSYWAGSFAFWFDPYDRIRLKILRQIIYRMEHPILG